MITFVRMCLFMGTLMALAFSSIGCSEQLTSTAEAKTTADPAWTSTPAELTRDFVIREDNRLMNLAEEAIQQYRVSGALNRLPGPGPFPSVVVDWQRIAALAISNAVIEPQDYDLDFFSSVPLKHLNSSGMKPVRDAHLRVHISYGMLQNGNSPLFRLIPSPMMKNAVNRIFLDPTTRSLAYKLTLPSIKAALAEMPAEHRREYLQILTHLRAYMNTFSIEKEDTFMQMMKVARSECRDNPTMSEQGIFCHDFDFTSMNPNLKLDAYRKGEAFLYRRVKDDGWKVEDIKSTLDQLIHDL